MDSAELQKYQIALKELQYTLEAEIDEASEVAPVEINGAMGRISRNDAMQVQQLALSMQRRRQERLVRIDAALSRMQKGSYGICVRCQKPIAEARLDAFPDVVLCVHCAS